LFISEYPKSIIFTEIALSLPSDTTSKNISYKFQFPSSNYSCCWHNFDSSDQPVELISYLNLFNLNEINSPPIARFPEHIYINLNKDFIYSLEVFDPDGDLFQCKSLSSIIISENCIITVKSNSHISESEIVIKIEIIEYNKKDEIRSRLPYHIIGLIDYEDQCYLLPSINLLNVENNQIHVLLNQSVQIHLISQSQCQIPMDECLINSAFHWKIKSIIEKNILNHQSQIEIEFEWIPKSVQQRGFHIHCIRCLDQLANYIDKCINIFVYGTNCRKFNLALQSRIFIDLIYLENLNPQTKICSWSPFSIWSKNNQTTYKRSRSCYETSNNEKVCSFCFGSSTEYQSSLAFTKGFYFFGFFE
jgi:hypothetical protein